MTKIERMIALYAKVNGSTPSDALIVKWRLYLGAFADVD